MDDDSLWGPPGEMPPQQSHPPHHPPMVRSVAAAAERPQRHELRRRGLLQRSISASHHHHHANSHGVDSQTYHHHYHHHFHHHHHYFHHAVPRAAWEYGPVVRGMPVLGEERGDWEPSNNYPAGATVAAVSAATRRRGAGGTHRRRRRLSTLFPWRSSRRQSEQEDADDGFDFSYEELIELDSRNVCRGLTEEELEKLGQFDADKEHMKSDCHICLDAVEKGAKVVSLKCGHLYHQECIHTWLKMKRTCPICRCEL